MISLFCCLACVCCACLPQGPAVRKNFARSRGDMRKACVRVRARAITCALRPRRLLRAVEAAAAAAASTAGATAGVSSKGGATGKAAEAVGASGRAAGKATAEAAGASGKGAGPRGGGRSQLAPTHVLQQRIALQTAVRRRDPVAADVYPLHFADHVLVTVAMHAPRVAHVRLVVRDVLHGVELGRYRPKPDTRGAQF